MSSHGKRDARKRLTGTAVVTAILCLGLLAPLTANAAAPVNGDFEAGSLAGWTSVNENEGAGSWFAYSGTVAPLSSEFNPGLIPPPQGKFAAIADQEGPGTRILYQDVALEPALPHSLSMSVYYRAEAPIVVPSPDTLSHSGDPNEQYRIDVMKPGAPLQSLDPADILMTLFETQEGDPEEMLPTTVSADLTPFAGQTVRLRLAEVDNLGVLNAGADAVTIDGHTNPPPKVVAPAPPSNAFTFGKLLLNRKSGTGKLQVNVPGPGALTVVDAGGSAAKGSAARASKKKSAPKLIKGTSVSAAAAGLVVVKLKPTGPGMKILRHKRKLSFKVQFTFTPTGGTAASQTFSGKLKLKPKPRKGR